MTTQLAFRGTYSAIVTPFRDDASIDWEALERLVEGQIAAGIAGVVPCGTTGESPALDREEQLELVKRCASIAKGRCAVIAGTGTNSTRGTVALSQAAERAGADAVMIVAPYYNKPTQEGLRRHFIEVASKVSCPVMVYNIPGRSGIDVAADTLAKVCEGAPNVVATKEATGNVMRAQQLARMLGDRLTVLSGDDALTLPMIAVGAKGVVSVTSNLYPAEVVRATALALDGKMDEARRAHLALLPVHEAMFVEANPSPVKAALAHQKRGTEVVRGPLAPISDAARARVVAAMKAYEGGRA